MESKARKLASKMQKDMLVPDSDEDFFVAKNKQEASEEEQPE
jgi:hypothetical protein